MSLIGKQLIFGSVVKARVGREVVLIMVWVSLQEKMSVYVISPEVTA